MKLGDAEYDKLVRKHMHKLTIMTPSECKSEVESIQGGAVSSFADELTTASVKELAPGIFGTPGSALANAAEIPKKRRGRPPGSKNRPRSGDKQ